MLKLKRVEIQGFKSFFDRTEMRFNGTGIAAVVGPNGCGKSNLSDAISWVLGEQSAKSLRGARMEDVIFAGTREKKPLGMAAVTMTLIAPDGRAEPVEVIETDSTPTNGNGTNGHNGGHNGHNGGLKSALGHAASSGYFPRTPRTQPAERARTDDACRGRPFRLSEMGRGRIERNGRSGIRTIVGIHFALTSSQPGHTGMP